MKYYLGDCDTLKVSPDFPRSQLVRVKLAVAVAAA
jgi:hypothetical protein